VEFRVLGPLEVWDDGRRLELRADKQRRLLGVLLAHANEVVSVERLVDELWDGRPPATARKLVQQYVAALRKRLGGDVIVTTESGYVIEVSGGQLDVLEFERLLGEGRGLPPQRAAATLREALALWRGPAADERLNERRLEALMARIDADLACGGHDGLVPELEALVAEHPYRERLRGQLMLGLYRSGRQAEALEAYREARRVLAEELGIDPGPELQALEQGILNQDASLAPVASRALPGGTVTFLFADVEGSTRLLQELGATGYADALHAFRQSMRDAAVGRGGLEVDTQGDAFFFVFTRAADAVSAAREAQARLADGRLQARIGLHTGEPVVATEGYVGIDVHRAARVCAAGHGGQVLLSQTTRELIEEDEVRDLGEHRLKDLLGPVRLFQLGEGDFPPPATLNHTNLPLQPTPFLGRERELAEVLSLLRRNSVRLLTLTGPGGSGKTRLALQAAAEAAADYTDGVFWVPLQAIRDPDLVEPTIAQAVGAKRELADHLVRKRVLLLLDNFEQVVDAAPVLADLLATCPGLNVLVTSRETLHLAAEHEYPVAPFVEQEAVGFFYARARAADPAFAGDGPVLEICRRLDCLPLALELAAARVKVLEPAALLERLERRLPLLTGGPRDAPAKQQTLRAAIEWSYDLLDEDEKALFAGLSVFAGGCTLDAAEQVCDADLDTLQSLVERNLVRREGDRYTMLETIREFAAERLVDSDEAFGLQDEHARYYLALAERLATGLEVERHRRRLEAEKVLRPEFANALAALDHFERAHDHDEEARLLLYLRLESRLELGPKEGLRRLERVLRYKDVPSGVRVSAFGDASGLALQAGDWKLAAELSGEQLYLARSLGDKRWIVRALTGLTSLAVIQGDQERARMLLREASPIAVELADETFLGNIASMEASLAVFGRRLEDAQSWYEQALGHYRRADDQVGIAGALSNLGGVALADGRIEDAAFRYRQSLELRRGIGSLLFAEYELDGLAAVAIARGAPIVAARLLGAADASREASGHAPEPFEARMRERTLTAVEVALGDEGYAATLVEGRAMTIEAAVDYALANVD
jgi:predicted ATPase/DNA-binding SARP family transcriptional activator